MSNGNQTNTNLNKDNRLIVYCEKASGFWRLLTKEGREIGTAEVVGLRNAEFGVPYISGTPQALWGAQLNEWVYKEGLARDVGVGGVLPTPEGKECRELELIGGVFFEAGTWKRASRAEWAHLAHGLVFALDSRLEEAAA